MRKERIPAFIIGTLVPIVAVLGLMPWYNKAEPFVLGFPFGYFWIFLWILLTPLCLLIAYKIDPYNKKQPIDESGAAGGSGKG